MAELIQELKPFERHPDTAVIEKMLRDCDVGNVVSYDDLTKRLGRDVRVHCWNYVRSAIGKLKRDGFEFVAVRNVGYQRLTEAEKISIKAHSAAKSGQRRFRSVTRTIERVDFSQLDAEHRQAAITLGAQAGAVELMTSASGTKRIEAATSKETQVPPVGKILELFL